MGGGYYSQDVAEQLRSSPREYNWSASPTTATARGVHVALNPYGKTREVNNETPIVVALDVTRSRGDDTKIVYQKLPTFMGLIELEGYVSGPGVSFAAIGDANSDRAPLQVGQFEGDNRLDEVLERFWIEEGGGGTGQESYELCAYFYSRTNCVRLAKGESGKGYFFFVGDEGFYPAVSKDRVKKLIGDELTEDLDAAEAFRRLQEKFHVFFVYPKKSIEERKKDIDAEIRARVLSAGGQYDNVDIRASLIWNSRNDLDLHVIPPSGEHIYYAHKQSACQGWLDVDMNVRGETEKPVENVRWGRGLAPAGRYQIYVQNYRHHDAPTHATPFKVELEVNGVIEHFEGVIPPGESGTGSKQVIATFDFDPSARDERAPKKDSSYDAYSDEVILAQWGSVLPAGHVLRIEDPTTIVEVLLGGLAIASGSRTLESYLGDLRRRGIADTIITQVGSALAGLSPEAMPGTVVGDVPGGAGQERPARTRRLT